ncbi:hypothetical protein GCM10009001_20180 [Virgibacillus siamensis]|uniref:DUF4829 domain-containing protein n=1 Tax=Virgibacillus siamensis TaxID=480071 RepID=A0ABP3RAQ3_9BACI
MRLKIFISLLVLMTALLGCNKTTDNPKELTLSFFKEAWMKHDFNEAKSLTENISISEIKNETQKVPEGYWKQFNKNIEVYYRDISQEGKEDVKSYILYAVGFRTFINLELKKASSGWVINDIQSKLPNDSKYTIEQMKKYDWKGTEIQIKTN